MKEQPLNLPLDHPDAKVLMRRRRAMNLANNARQDRDGFHCPRCTFASRRETELAMHILHSHLAKPAELPAGGEA